MLELFWISAIIMAAAFISGLTGFGFVLVALPLLSFFIDIKTSIPLMILLAVCISVALSIQLRKDADLRIIMALAVPAIPGTLLGTYVLKTVPSEILTLGVGILLALFTTYQLIGKPKTKKLGMSATSISGFLSGVLGGSIAAGGPPVIIYSAIQPWTKDQAKATLSMYFAFHGMLIVCTHAWTGMITGEVLRLYVTSLPALAVGTLLGLKAYTHLSDHGYKTLAFVLVFILGCMMIWKSF